MHRNEWNYLKWRLPDTCRKTLSTDHSVKECYYIRLVLSSSKQYDLFKLITETGKEIAIFCKNTIDNEVTMYKKIRDILQRNNCSVKVPRCYGFWKNKLFMEYIKDSITLEQFLSSSYTLSELESLLENLGRFLALLHHNRFLHRDLNLSNILYSPKTQNIHIIDFELSEENTDRDDQNNIREIESIKRKLSKHIRTENAADALTVAYYTKLRSLS